MKCLTIRLQTWFAYHSALSFMQKGFSPFDGCLEHNYVLEQHIKEAKIKHQDLCIAFLDLSNAFGELPHSAVFDAIAKSGLGDDFLVFIQDVYADNTTCIMTPLGPTTPVPV